MNFVEPGIFQVHSINRRNLDLSSINVYSCNRGHVPGTIYFTNLQGGGNFMLIRLTISRLI